MSATQILLLAIAGIGSLAILSIISIAWRRGTDPPGIKTQDSAAVRQDLAAEDKADEDDSVTAYDVAELVSVDSAPTDPLVDRQEVDAETMGVTRRQFFNRGLLGVFGLFLAQFGIASLAFLWPRLKSGGFGSKVNVGKIEDLRIAALTADGRARPVFVSAAQAYVVPVQGSLDGSSFEGLPVVAGGMMALWQRCVHLGCRVPECESSQGFECPCHGSKYNFHGEYEDGPAPRNLDRFVVSLNDADELIIDTGDVIETARASFKTIEYPQGPSCI
ncbi:MAG: ubiquinol-cytochrome c reductase iron-sulfur subunit [Acidobacteria bacterium]|nr:ubiquinol-cytochrome c reductase iron-sulfur subunit [Acidobacteriota bacterium]